MAAKTQTIVTKAVLSRTNGKPIATVKVPANVRSIRLAGAYTTTGDAVNIALHKITANKRFAKTQRNNLFGSPYELSEVVYHAESGTYQIVKKTDF